MCRSFRGDGLRRGLGFLLGSQCGGFGLGFGARLFFLRGKAARVRLVVVGVVVFVEQNVDSPVRDSLMAIDAGQAFRAGVFMLFLRPFLLHIRKHGIPGMAVAAFAAVRLLHVVPDMLGQRQALVFEFLGRIDGAPGPSGTVRWLP